MSDWKNMDQWFTVLPPSRPTDAELFRIESFLSNYNRNDPIAILGSTPEFRELLYRLGFKHRYIFDRSIDFYYRMSNLMPASAYNGEYFVFGDWINSLREFHHFFQAVLSDLTMGNIKYEDRKAFYSSISDSLIANGVFIDKVLAFDFNVPTLNELFEKYERLPINLRTINDFSSEVLFCSELVTKSNIVDSTSFYSIIRQGNYSEKIKYLSEAAHMITPEGFVWYYGIKWDKLKDDYCVYYKDQLTYIENDMQSPYYHRTKQFFNIK